MRYAKLAVQVVVTVAVALVAALAGDNVISSVEWVNVAIVGVGAAAVFYGPNVPHANVTKFVMSALAAVLVVLSSAITDGIQVVEIIQMLIAAAGAVGVYAVPNKDNVVTETTPASY